MESRRRTIPLNITKQFCRNLTFSSDLIQSRWGPWPASEFSRLQSENIATETPPNGIDDLYIAVVVRNIDGPGSRFAEAGQSILSPSSGSVIPDIPAGTLVIDPNDIQTVLENDIFVFLMFHEIGHILGIGTLWNDFIDGSSYTGESGLQNWRDIGCSGDLPLGANNDNSHWNEECLGNEM
eukprot:scaffold1953_cov176-Amphora_coffeaeformis.AAC.20